ncbi:MAX dimerization protein MGA a isoform X2 [Salminus brasiliensis]|uniref:MAX dimerization protein MGA a isoform X2 n=1 Tax=Salminus brasiliensis TaxID=930266 RepID=UPI003B833889
MAITDNQAIMVIHQDGMTTSALAPQTSSPHSLFVVLKPLHPGGGGQAEGAILANKDTRSLGTSTVGFQKLSSMSLSAMAGTNSSNQHLPAEITCKGITVTLDNNNMWNEFYRCQTEMILTKQGRRMFPYCRFRISGLEPFQRYTFIMDMHPVDNHRYKWSDRRWETNGKADPHIVRSFVHPESPATGLDWMQNPVSFYKLKLTNNPLDQESHIIINSMHRYLPRLHIVPADKTTDAVELNGPDVITFSFPQTEFFAVTAYQNLCITQLKIDYNPFAKGFRDDANNSRSCKPKNGLPTETVESEAKPSRETTTLNNLKTLFAKRNAAGKALKGQSLPVAAEEDLKSVSGGISTSAELEKSCSKKRPLAEGLSELIKGAHVKVKRISLEKVHDGSDQPMNTVCLPEGEMKKDSSSDGGELENLSVAPVDTEVTEDKKKLKKGSGISDVKNVTEAEGPLNANTVSNSNASDVSTVKSTTDSCHSITTNMQICSSSKYSDAFVNEKVDTALSETAEKNDGKEDSQTMVKPLDGGEVKKKRAEPVPLPLLALFLQQLKSKTRPARPKSKCETSSSPSHSEKSCKTPSIAENVSPSTASLSPTLTTQSNVQTAASPTPETSAPPASTSPVANTTVSPCLSLLPATSSSTSLTTSPTLPDMTIPFRPAPSLVVADPDQGPDSDSDLDPEYTNTPTLHSDTNFVTVPTENMTSDTVLVSKQEDAPVSLSSFANDIVPDSISSGATTDTVAISEVLSDAPCAPSPSSPSKTIASVFDGPQNEVVCSNVNTTDSSADATLDSCIVPCAEFVPEAPYQSPLSEDDINVPLSPSSAGFSIPSPTPSSPDPFPPGLFCDRPIPPRKSLDPFPPCLSFDRPRPPVDVLESVPVSLIFTKPGCPGDSHFRSQSASTELTSLTPAPEPCISKDGKQSKPENVSKKSKVKHKRGGKSKLSDDAEVAEGPIPVPMQPSLEDVEGQLFVSFMSKKALEIHLGDEVKEEALQKTENIYGEKHQSIEERIDALEKVLLRDLKMMKHRQVIHPVLQAVGLKLHLLDLSLAIDLQYLGVCLPIPPPVLLPGENSGSSASSQVPFVSRTGKTTDFTKIKGWRDKFSSSNSSALPGGTSSDTGQKNLSAFCSDMLDEYLESEGKLIDERAASFSQAVVTPVAYQLPTKSTSYVRTLDSVLKKQAPQSTANTLSPTVASTKSTLTSKSKELGKLGKNASRQSIRSGAAKTASSTVKPTATSSKDGPRTGENSSKRSMKSVPSKPVYTSAPFSLSPSKKSLDKIKTKKGSKTAQASVRPEGKAINSILVAAVGQDSGSPGSVAGGRLSKYVVKLLDVEDGAVWEGKRRTFITEERAAIALSSLVTAEDKIKGSPSPIIKRRAPPCLNDFCRLGCVCASLAQDRRQHHCGKPQCMLGCDCLRRKVVLLRNPTKNENSNGAAVSEDQQDEKGYDMTKKKKRKKAYILSGPEAAPEPATHVKRLWNYEKNYTDPECIFVPLPARPHCSPDLQKELENCPQPSKTHGRGMSTMRGNKESLACARVRPFCRKDLPNADQQGTKGGPHPGPKDSIEEMEEGELRPPALFGPTKRLEIVSKCKWTTAGSRNVVLRVVCERMAQDRLRHPFWVGKYQIEPISKTVQETDKGSTITYKISISQPNLQKNVQKNKENERIKQLEDQLFKTIGKSEVKGLPLLSHVTPAGLLKAEKKPPGASGQITVNGKPYPQAKLELGQMGALHPANRLAAYITGRVCLANQNASKTVTTATVLTTSPTAPTTTTTTTTTAVATTSSVTSTPSVVMSVKPKVTKPPVGTVFTQVVINHMNSQQQKLPSTSTCKNIIKPSSSSVTDVSVSSNAPQNANVTSQAAAASGLTDGPTIKSIPVSASTASVKKTVVITTAGSHTVTPGGGVRLMQPVTSVQPPVPGQKMVFQMLKTANGSTLYRNPNGQLIQLVPLNQFRALLPRQTTIVRFPATTASKPQNGSSFTSSSPATSSTLLLKAQNPTPVHSTSAVVHSTTTVSTTKAITASVAETVASLSSTKLSQPSTLNLVPRIIECSGTGIVKIVPQAVLKDSKNPSITVTTLSTKNTLNPGPANRGFILISSLTTQNQDSLEMKADSSVHITPVQAEGSKQNIQSSNCSEKSSESVVLEDHCYTFEAKKTSTSREKPGHVPKDDSSADACSPKMLPEDVLEFAPIEEDESDTDATLGPEPVGKSKAELSGDLQEDEIDSELTEDSDMYDESNTSDQEDLYIDTDSDGEENQKRRSVVLRMQDLEQKEADELVDIETCEERDEKNTEPNDQSPLKEHDKALHRKQKLKEQEMERRSCLKEWFHKLQMTINLEDSKASKMTILKLACDEIHTLSKQTDELEKLEEELKKKRAYYLHLASQLSGKTKESISWKLREIITKQKSLESQDMARNTTQPVPKHSLIDVRTEQNRLQSKDNVKDTVHRCVKLSSNSKPVDLSIIRQKRLGSQDINFSAKQKLSEAEKKGKDSIGRPSQAAKPLLERHLPPALLLRERTRPNILSRSKSQSLPVSPDKEQAFVPQVIPLVETMVPCNQIITISNPLQPIGITSLGERQSATPGVAAVSISVPAVSHPIKVENPVPVVLQPQVLSPLKINSPGKTVNLPKISSVVSLVQSEKLLVTPPVVLQTTDVPPVETQASCNTVVESKQPEQGTKVNMADATAKRKEERKDKANNETEVENLMSLLDELDFLNQQLNSEPSQPQGGDSSDTKASSVPTDLLTEKKAGVDIDDERSLSPLFLRLDEDLMVSTTSKDELDDIPPKVDDLVKVIFGSDSPPNSSESDVTAGASDDGNHGRVKSDAPSPPPLLQMKAGGGTTSDTLKEQVGVSWRPMPKLAPLGLKTQESGQNKTVNPHASKPGTQLPNLRSAHM